MNYKNEKIVLILLICLIFAGTVIVCFKGFNVGLPYKSNINISVYVGKNRRQGYARNY